MYTRYKLLLGSTDSRFTSNAYLTADFRDQSLSILTSTASASNFTVQGTNWQGFSSAIPEAAWSNLTVISAAGLQTVDPGMRWLRVIRPNIGVSAASNVTIEHQGKAIL